MFTQFKTYKEHAHNQIKNKAEIKLLEYIVKIKRILNLFGYTTWTQ